MSDDSRREDRASELGAAETMAPSDFETEQPTSSGTQASRPCPNCGRMIEPGFKFCDGCGTKLEGFPLEPAQPKDAGPLLPIERNKPLLERLRERRNKPKPVLDKPSPPPPDVTTPQTPVPPPPATPPAPKPPPSLQAEPKKRRVAIAGRLRSKDGKRGSFRPATTTPRPPSWRPVPGALDREVNAAKLSPMTVGLFALHLLIALIVGVVVLGLVAGVAAVASEGRLQLLEQRGLPIFVGGASSIVVFALLRTSGREGSRSRAGGTVGVLVGFLILIAAAAVLLQPGLADPQQRSLERLVGVYGSNDIDAARDFRSDIRGWNAGSARFQANLLKLRKGDIDLLKFRGAAIDSEGELTGTIATMRSHAEAVKNAPLRDALDDLTAIYEDRLSSFRVVATGFIGGDDKLVRAGNARYQESKARVEEVFTERLRPLLEDAGLNVDSFGSAISGTG